MIITAMTATFGCLENATLRLSPGLNLLELPNEGGKSTWCAFLRGMFYGLESRKGGANSERNRFTPWSGAPMSGTVELLWRGRSVTLRRFPKGSSPFGGFQAVYTGTEEAVPGLTADNAGEVLLGCSREVFQRTCFIPQGGMGVDKSGDLERRVAALATAGEEDVSFSDTQRRLKDWRNAIQYNKSGSLPRLRAKLEDLAAQDLRSQGARERAAQARQALEELERRRGALQADLRRREAAAQEERSERERLAAQGEETCRRMKEEAQAAQTRSEGLRPSLSPLLPLLLGAAGGLALALAAALLPLLPLLFSAPLPLLLGGLAAWRLARRRALWRQAKGEADALTRRWEARQEEYLQLLQTLSAPADPSALDALRRELAQTEQSIARWSQAQSHSLGEVQGLGDPGEREAQAQDLRERIAQEEGDYAALTLALDALTAANAQLQSRFSPLLNQKTGQLLARLTGGRYAAVSLTRDFQALAQADQGLRATQFLSQGTADQVYLALRLAICLLALPQEDPAPLVLDDALVTFDDRRLRLALALLEELAADRQVLLFTCQGRERSALG